jgi:lysozyme family protein
MKTVRQIAEDIVGREGGFVNDPDDPGGATNHGVTIHTMRRLGLDLTGDGAVDVADVRALTRAQAVDIYIRHYFDAPGLGRLPECLQASVFDMFVNAGSNAIRILQQMLARMGFETTVDGVLGQQTVRHAHAAAARGAQLLADAYGVERRSYYYRLADGRPASRKYARRKDGGKGGWILRAEEFISPRFHLSEAEHRRRVAAWG